jgi:tRNA pseudouridine55 synthase
MSILPSGLLAVYKPKGITSAKVVEKFVKILGNPKLSSRQQREHLKIGHGGTLDPSAEGVLVLGIQKGTKLLNTYLKGKKRYYGVGLLGIATDSLDSDGVETERKEYRHVKYSDLEEKLPKFIGDILQMPPMYSALKKNGTPLYRLARQGITIDRQPRKIHIDSIVLDPTIKLPSFGIHVECGGGCYVRSLIADIATECNTCGHLTSLIRTQQGPFIIKDCLEEAHWNTKSIVEAIARCNRIAKLPEEYQ